MKDSKFIKSLLTAIQVSILTYKFCVLTNIGILTLMIQLAVSFGKFLAFQIFRFGYIRWSLFYKHVFLDTDILSYLKTTLLNYKENLLFNKDKKVFNFLTLCYPDFYFLYSNFYLCFCLFVLSSLFFFPTALYIFFLLMRFKGPLGIV